VIYAEATQLIATASVTTYYNFMALIPETLPSGSCYGTPQQLLELFAQYLTIPAFAISTKVLYGLTSPSPDTGYVWINTTGGDTPLLNLYNDATSAYEPFPFVGGTTSNERLISDKTAVTTLANSDLFLVGTLGGGSYSSLKKITWANMAGQIPAGSVTYPMLSTSATEANNVAKRVARAWVNFNGQGTVAIRDSVNVSSISDNGVGNYTINFTVSLGDADYCWSLGGRGPAGTGFYSFSNGDVAAPTATAFSFITLGAANSSTFDQPYITATFFN
jgi:hypothetical protein